MLKLVFTFFSIIPLRFNHFIGLLIGKYLYLTDSNSKLVVSKNIKACFPNLRKAQQQELIKKSLIETGKGLSESGFIWLRSFDDNARHVVKTTGIESLKSNRPIILLAPHFGCWELAARMSSLHKPTLFMYKKLKENKQNKLLLSFREQGDLSMATADKKGVIKLQRAINNKELIGILPDQDPGEEGSVLSPFFNQDARTMTLLVKLARKNNAKVVMTWANRLESGKGYELNFKPVNVLSDSGDIDEDVRLMNKTIEELVMSNPSQYLWNYKRFKSVISY